ncbi:hypothetical protein MAFF211479_30780 [Ralstonia solanacearum]|nr:hypothetical protein MAFF211479_30780 [Ralstonia solanacearum]BCN05944.1 hypothetical protein RPSB_30810 [Ralstonia solanacearum]
MLATLRLKETTNREYVPESQITGTALPSGWYLVFFNDPLPPEMGDDTLSKLSNDTELIACVVEEASMVSWARGYSEGANQWSVVHDANQGLNHLEERGIFPGSYFAVRDRLLEKCRAGAAVDYLFDLPAELSKLSIGFRHDEDIEGVDGDPFVVLERL